MYYLFAYAGEDHGQTEIVREGLLTTIGHWPTLVSLVLVAVILVVVFVVLGWLKIAVMNRVIILLPLMIVLAVIYMGHNPLVSTVLLAAGFAGIFLLVITLLSTQRQ